MSDWLGAGSFKKLLLAFEDPHLRFSSTPPGYVYDPSRHRVPPAKQRAAPGLAEATEPVADLVERLYGVIGLPRLDPLQYQIVFEALAGQSGQGSTLGDITKNARDYANDQGASIGRQAFAFVTRALHLADHPIADKQASPDEIAHLFRSSVQQQARDAQLELEAEDLRLLDELLGVAVSPDRSLRSGS